MARPMIADGRGHDVFPASEKEFLDELRRLELRLEREESERESRDSRDDRDRERRDPLSESSSSSLSKSSSSSLIELLREREDEDPNESPLRDDRCAATGSTVHAVRTHAERITRKDKKSGFRRLEPMVSFPRRSVTAWLQR